jgi:hypothetical protein
VKALVLVMHGLDCFRRQASSGKGMPEVNVIPGFCKNEQ